MAIQQLVGLDLDVIGDGTSTTFSFDLLKHPYSVTGAGATDIAFALQNWFEEDQKNQQPVALSSYVLLNGIASGLTASLSGTVITLTFATAPANGAGQNVQLQLLFDGV